jgi:hypothetical protein
VLRHPVSIITMEVRQFIRPGVTLSAIVHVSALALIVLFSEVHPFGTVTAEPVAVDLVTPEEVGKQPEPDPTPTPTPTPQTPLPDFSQLLQPETPAASPSPAAQPPAASPPAAPAAATPPPAAPPPQQQQATPPRRQDTALRPQSQPQPQPSSPTSAPAANPGLGYMPAQPDITVKYHVMLGLPEAMPLSAPGSGKKDDFDATDSTAADLSSSLIAEFRRHLKTCARLPASVAPSDNLVVKLRVLMTVDGRLAADPLVAGGSANPKALDLLQSAIDALKSCQPYAMLPADRYGEWKVLDLDFTPRDFAS